MPAARRVRGATGKETCRQNEATKLVAQLMYDTQDMRKTRHQLLEIWFEAIRAR